MIRLIHKSRFDLHDILHEHIKRAREYADALRAAGKFGSKEYMGAHNATLTGHRARECIILEPRDPELWKQSPLDIGQ